MNDLEALLARVPEYREFFTLEELQTRSQRLGAEFPGLIRREIVGASAEGRPIELVTVGHGRTPVLLVGVPHPNEPIGTLTVDFLCRLLCEDATLRARLDITLHAVQVADPDGYVLNEGWFKGIFSPLRYALNYYRPPHREQVEWSFPVDYKTLRFTTPAPETAAIMRVMERVRPRVFYSLHNAGFCGVYFYVSRERPELFSRLHRLVASQGLPLHRGEPEVPYLRTLAPAIYALFGIDATYEYLARTLGEDPAAVIEAGTSSDDWLARVGEAFSLVCELPYYTAPALEDTGPAGRTRRDAVLAGAARAAALLAERAEAEMPSYDREATRAEALDATVCKPFNHMLYLGEVYRLAEIVGEHALASRLHARLADIAADIEQESALRVLPLRPLVAIQAGAGLLALDLPIDSLARVGSG